jgi:[ribosomal protein S5]-alanine N-acetyltransferase
MKTILETDRLYLREFTLTDAQLLIDLNSDPEVTRYTGDGPVADLTEAKRILEEIIFPQYGNRMGRWAVHLKNNGEFIGWSGIKYLESLDEYDLGYRFFRRHWGKGYATESAKAVMEYAVKELKLKNIVGRASVDNYNSIKVLEKVGLKFQEEGFEHGEKIVKYGLNIR